MVELIEVGIDYRSGRRHRRLGARRNGGGESGERVIRAVAGANASFATASITAIVGPSGCGKTSLVHAIAGLVHPTAGRVLIEGRPVAGVRAATSVIFQDYGLLPWRTVEGNAELPLALAGVGKAERRRRVRPLLDEFGLSDFSGEYPHRLSGGMKQRVAIARALVGSPDLLLMDEPFSSLDALTREAAQDFLLGVARSRGMTVVVVTHSIEEAVYLSEAVYVMTGRNPGTISARFDVAGRGASVDDFRSTEAYLAACASVRAALRGGAFLGGDAGGGDAGSGDVGSGEAAGGDSRRPASRGGPR